MPTPAQITVSTLRDQIKWEARVKGSDNLDQYVLDTINELLLDYTEKNRYFELLILNSPITTVALNNGVYALPLNFFAVKLLRYQPAITGSTGSLAWTINKRTEWIENPRGTMPRYYDIAGTNLNVYPFTDVPDGDTLLLDYYFYPQILALTDMFPIPRLIPTLKLRATHRVLLYNNNLQQAQALQGESMELDGKVRPN